MTHRTAQTPNRLIDVPSLARVEGDGALHIALDGDRITDLRLEIYEPPRFFEAFLVGRHVEEVPDIVPRICGICPVAYQMSAILGLERLFEIDPPAGTPELRRLLYLAEWIESHMLHVHLLAAPDLLGYESAIELARHERAIVERGLSLKRLGNDLMALIGGREIHPVTPRVGGFSRTPLVRELRAFEPRLEQAADDILGVADWAASLPRPSFSRPVELVSLRDGREYPVMHGDVVSSEGRRFAMDHFEDHVEEEQVPHSNALHAHLVGGGTYFLGPLSRVNLNAELLGPLAREALGRVRLQLPTLDPFASMAARVVETAQAIGEALALLRTYERGDPAPAHVEPRPGRATWITEAPRGMLYHRYGVAADGTILAARIVPPTSQNLARIEEDLRRFLPDHLDEEDAELSRLCEMVVRNYDPCISCATHFLTLDLQRSP
jgi:coenzyme F420-reducing hydrogenase alpha subunit